ncbi:MAG: D-alanyl-D-alanine carboxypeptidase/D-alanyl-D-alanine-endopeptidase [Phycisphaerales bacterium]
MPNRPDTPRRPVRRRPVICRVAAVMLLGVVTVAGMQSAAFARPLASPVDPQVRSAPAALNLLPDFQREIERLIEAATLGSAVVGVSIVDSSTGRTLTDIRADEPRIPASNMKLLTSGTALHVMGPEFRYRTRLLHDGDRLVVLGDGDPCFGDPVLLDETRIGQDVGIDAEDLLSAWVDAVKQRGIERIETLVVDDRIFDRDMVHPGWPRDQLHRHYCAGVAGVNFHANVLHYFPFPNPGGRAQAGPSVPEANWITVSSQASSDRDGANQAYIIRAPGPDSLRLMGNVRSRFGVPIPITVEDPSLFFARLLLERLRTAGVEVGEARLATTMDRAATGDLVGPIIATRMETVLERCNTDSFNLAAESLLKRSAAARGQVPGSFAGGAAVIRSVIAERLGDTSVQARIVISDGSGLSRSNAVPPSLLTAWLRSFDTDEELGPIFRASLATPGNSGTLARRLPRLPSGITLRAKTGFINNVSCLSGYVEGPTGTLCFSVMVNDFKRTAGPAKSLQDGIVKLMAEGLADAARRSVTEAAGR